VPSPLGHALAGLTVHTLASRTGEELHDVRRAVVTVGAALAADLDLLLRFVDGRNHHGNETHSVGCAILVALAAAALFSRLRWRRPFGLALAVGGAWVSHILLDYLNVDTHPPIGIMALWPFVPGWFKFPWPIFLDIGRTLEWATVRHDLVAAAWEACLLGPLLGMTWRWRRRRLG
jgi:membrane-bound metal-dependent hydrolase YbcI (DUF457 family)